MSRRVAKAVAHLLKYAVIYQRHSMICSTAWSSPTTVIHKTVPGCFVEALIPDFKGYDEPLKTVLAARPEVLNHNIETVERCYDAVRPQAVYWRSIELFERAKRIAPNVRTKSGIMLGVGETWGEILHTMRDLRAAGVDTLTIGQYLAPSAKHVPISRYYTPEEFAELKRVGLALGFGYVESAAGSQLIP